MLPDDMTRASCCWWMEMSALAKVDSVSSDCRWIGGGAVGYFGLSRDNEPRSRGDAETRRGTLCPKEKAVGRRPSLRGKGGAEGCWLCGFLHVLHVGEEFLGALADLFCGQVFLVRGDGPYVSKWIGESSVTVAPEHVGR